MISCRHMNDSEARKILPMSLVLDTREFDDT